MLVGASKQLERVTSYEAALPNWEAFCMRDVSHQAIGAAMVGLNKHNLNMFQKFAIAATIRLRSMKSENSFTIPGGLTVPVLAMVGTLWFLSNLAAREIIATGIFLLFFTGVYFIMKKASSGNRQP